VNDALGSGATRTIRENIKGFLDGGVTTALDPDGNGTADALSDGILILRYLFDPSGQWNVADALGSGATRTTRDAITQRALAPPRLIQVLHGESLFCRSAAFLTSLDLPNNRSHW